MDNIEHRIASLERTVAVLEGQVQVQAETARMFSNDVREIANSDRLALDEFRRSLADQEARWTKAHKELTTTAIELMQEAMLKALARKLLDWLWTIVFSSFLVGLGWLATHSVFVSR